ncbi:hypothetical protein Glove_26g248 [Diversispora epigaea]|uniref:Uncharacterized protein n=1 Tax=Diversispora epigaea TaxID=1348612 RepID=A0A397JIA3_9GLOM|nr:hypothetical protein Glove_26g248 [Diversispora epigaea]
MEYSWFPLKNVRDRIDKKIEEYILSLKTIINNEGGQRREKAKKLLDNYDQGIRPDRKVARECEEEHSHKQVHIHQPTFTEIAGGATVYGREHFSCLKERKRTGRSLGFVEEEPLLMRMLRKRKSINNSELDYVEKYKRVKSTSDKEDIYVEETVDDEIEKEEDDKSEGEDETESNLIDPTNFNINYHNLNPQKMWTLKSGRVVEKVIYEYTRKLTHESYLHLFIITVKCHIKYPEKKKLECTRKISYNYLF